MILGEDYRERDRGRFGRRQQVSSERRDGGNDWNERRSRDVRREVRKKQNVEQSRMRRRGREHLSTYTCEWLRGS